MKTQGYIYVVHGIACMALCGIGFRPFGMWYLPVFLIAEFPNIFVRIEKLLDKNNLRDTLVRRINRYIVLTTYLAFRIVPGFGYLVLLTSDILKAINEPNQDIRVQYIIGDSSRIRHGDSEVPIFGVKPLPVWLAFIPVASMALLNVLGIYWFTTMLGRPFQTPVEETDNKKTPPAEIYHGKKKSVLDIRTPHPKNELSRNEVRLENETMPIAIIGMGCRLAGGATNPEKLWEMVAAGRDGWSEIPAGRFKKESFYHPNGAKQGATNVRGAHFLEEDISLFDAPFFNISLEEAKTFAFKSMDPQLRLQLECTYEALESAGITLPSIANSDTSVYSGIFARDYHESMVRDIETLPRYFNTGTGAAMFSNRLSYFFDLKGPSMTVDTGCSTSIVALHLACQSLKSRESKMSIVGGNNIMLNPDMITAMSSFGFVSPDGRSYAFDHRASGYGRGEGVASIVLKPLEDALRDGDPIRAVIRHTCLNQDGKTAGITLPSQEAQESLFRSAYEAAGLDPSETSYVEAHGTGTQAGDPLEAGAISAVFARGRARNNPVYIGSVKTNIGHLEAGSGLAGILKATLVLEKGAIPPSINFEKANPKIPMKEWNIKTADPPKIGVMAYE
ncbi:hypothetical protein PVAG01_01144 [Phlyctema vagabunda]|uniref:Polyketide synthase n=1 Tax=Phlyctema vagabunda TaxID=108571 RepID=A0ABR4PW93_9HELO